MSLKQKVNTAVLIFKIAWLPVICILYSTLSIKYKINYNAIEKPSDFEEDCQLFQELSAGTVGFDEAQFRLSANSLFELLLKDPLSGLDEKVSRLIIIPDDLLLSFSFDNMLYEKSQRGAPFPYLLKRYAISIAYSNQLLFSDDILKNKKQPDNLFAGFGLEYNDFTLEGLNLLSSMRNSSSANMETGKLIYSDDEVLEIAALLKGKGKSWVNEAATKSNFLQNAGKYRLLHFAMHGILDEEKPLNSSLIFFRDSDSTDFQLRASELYHLELNADMVVLSACHTGAGKIAKGEGVRSLARAFAYAGSPALVTSLWSASDHSTKEILVPFYQNLYEGMPKDIALQQAKLKYLEQTSPSYALPSFWSHLSVVGNTEPIVFELAESNRTPWIMAGLALICFLFIRRVFFKNETITSIEN